MSGAKGAKLAGRAGRVGPRKHHCPTCLKDDSVGAREHAEAPPTMLFPGRRMVYICSQGHRWNRGETVLV